MFDDLLYRLAAGLSGGLFGAIAGALGAAVALLIASLFKRTIPQSWKVGTVTIGIALGLFFGKAANLGVGFGVDRARDVVHTNYVRPQVDKIVVRRSLRNAGEAARMYQLLEEKEPETFELIVEAVAKNTRSNATEEEVVNIVRGELIKRVTQPRFGYLSDDDMLDAMTLVADMAGELAQSSPGRCIAMLKSEDAGDLRPFISRGAVRREAALMEKLISVRPHQIQLQPADVVQAINLKVAQELIEKHSDKISLLNLSNLKPGEERASCLLFVDYLRGVLRLPRTEAVVLFRAMYLDPARFG